MGRRTNRLSLPLPREHVEFSTGDDYMVTGRSMVVLGLVAEGATEEVLLELEAAIHQAAQEMESEED